MNKTLTIFLILISLLRVSFAEESILIERFDSVEIRNFDDFEEVLKNEKIDLVEKVIKNLRSYKIVRTRSDLFKLFEISKKYLGSEDLLMQTSDELVGNRGFKIYRLIMNGLHNHHQKLGSKYYKINITKVKNFRVKDIHDYRKIKKMFNSHKSHYTKKEAKIAFNRFNDIHKNNSRDKWSFQIMFDELIEEIFKRSLEHDKTGLVFYDLLLTDLRRYKKYKTTISSIGAILDSIELMDDISPDKKELMEVLFSLYQNIDSEYLKNKFIINIGTMLSKRKTFLGMEEQFFKLILSEALKKKIFSKYKFNLNALQITGEIVLKKGLFPKHRKQVIDIFYRSFKKNRMNIENTLSFSRGNFNHDLRFNIIKAKYHMYGLLLDYGKDSEITSGLKKELMGLRSKTHPGIPTELELKDKVEKRFKLEALDLSNHPDYSCKYIAKALI